MELSQSLLVALRALAAAGFWQSRSTLMAFTMSDFIEFAMTISFNFDQSNTSSPAQPRPYGNVLQT
jgi:hypothetical protein